MPATSQEVVLITGANTGIGYELARKLLRDHHRRFYVLIGARNSTKGEAAVKTLHNEGLVDCELLLIDVSQDDSIAQAAKAVEEKFGRLDVLHANAGIAPIEHDKPGNPSTSQRIMTAMETNAAGTAQTAQTFVPLLQNSENPRIIFMSSALGSLQTCHDSPLVKSWLSYAASKAALNMIMCWFYQTYPDIRVNACSPGFRATQLNNFGRDAPPNLTPSGPEMGTLNAERLTLLGKDGETGTFTRLNDETGEVDTLPW